MFRSKQMVRTPGRRKPPIIVRRSPLGKTRAIVRFGPLAFPAAIGRSGVTSRKREGDGATPKARMRLEYGHYRGDRLARPATRLVLTPIRSDAGWCDAPAHPAYNRAVRLPFSASHENMTRDDRLYDIVLVMDWNRRQRRRGAGSAIFFHLARSGFQPTEGCIAVTRLALTRILAHAGPETEVIVL